MKAGDMVKLAHYGTLVHKEEFEERVVPQWGVGLVTRVLSGRNRPGGAALPASWDQVEVLWSTKGILKIEDIEAVEVIN